MVSRKVSDLKGEESDKLYDEIKSVARMANISSGDYDDISGKGEWKECGLCGDCDELIAMGTRYGTTKAHCRKFGNVVNPIDPVIRCSIYNQKTALTLWDMKDIAWLIDPDSKEKIGFGSDKE